MRAMIPIFALLGMVCSPGTSQTLAVDPFIGSIEVMKHSVATVACMVVNDVESKILTRRGSAFFISVSGDWERRFKVPPSGGGECPFAAMAVENAPPRRGARPGRCGR